MCGFLLLELISAMAVLVVYNFFSFELFRGSREYSEETLKLACDYQQHLSADFGGTEILTPLQAIYNRQPRSTHSRQVGKLLKVFILLTHLILLFASEACSFEVRTYYYRWATSCTEK
jgi:hypothetical protein